MRNAAIGRKARRYGVAGLGAALALASAAFALTPASAAQPVRPSMLFAGSSELQSIYCTSGSNCWAAGLLETKNFSLINELVHWNGHSWSQASVPDPAGRDVGASNELNAVRCASAVNCWAVGFYITSTASFAQMLHWNGKHWRLTPVPEPGGKTVGDSTTLIDVSCTSASSCWAVGDYGHSGLGSDKTFNLAVHWNGKKWAKVKAPSPAAGSASTFNILGAVRCASPGDCWAAGSAGVSNSISTSLNQVLHWNGTKWSEQDVPSPGGLGMGSFSSLSGLSCTSATDCWAVGSYDSNAGETTLNQTLRWNGHDWTVATTPSPDGTASGDESALSDVNCSAAGNCWAVGTLGDNSTGGSQTGEALHWQGTAWKQAATPNPAGTTDEARNILNSVRCVSAKDCWIVGFSQVSGDPDASLFLHWNSKKWSVG